ncbi:CASP-like protein 2C1 [Corylus avellana]|uniref:CASP-like protein 2C1 n=1 Tax=Corylus avellana TaxID=13451 RepID=UPI00286BE8B8|nr:CASP-like protein 2C1 [Corylus avellana]
MEVGINKINVFLRLSALLFSVLTACLVGLDAQSKRVFFSEKKATFRDLDALVILVYVESGAACYNLLQLCKFSIPAWSRGNSKMSFVYVAWVFLLLDQLAAYITFAANSAALEAAFLAVTGANELQWMKLCNRFTRFCIQIGGALICGFLSSLLMAVISSISAFNLFRLYSPKRFLLFKQT